MVKRDNLFVPNKMEYVRGAARPQVDCILCGVARGDHRVKRLEVFRTHYFVASLNLYPYSPGHMILFPMRHVTDLRELSMAEAKDLFQAEKQCLTLLEQEYNPGGFNLGYNQGHVSGASIAHLHLHIVPRYGNEIGFIDIVGGARVIVQDPKETLRKLRRRHAQLNTKKPK